MRLWDRRKEGKIRMKITEQQLFDYISCPAMYQYKHEQGIDLYQSKTVKDLLITTANYFYTYVFENKKTPTLKVLSNKFEALYLKHKQDIPEKKYNEGLLSLRNFYNWACSEKIVVADSCMPYNLTYKGVSLTGILSPIAINNSHGNKMLEFLILNFSGRNIDQLTLDTKLKYSIDMLAFNHNNGATRISGIKHHHIKTGKDMLSMRSQIDNDRALATIEGVALGIKNKVFYPRESVFCSTCEYRHMCRSWKREVEV